MGWGELLLGERAPEVPVSWRGCDPDTAAPKRSFASQGAAAQRLWLWRRAGGTTAAATLSSPALAASLHVLAVTMPGAASLGPATHLSTGTAAEAHARKLELLKLR